MAIETTQREAVMDLIVATESLMEAFKSLMPGLKHIAVADYMLINDAPIQAARAIANIRRKLGR